MLKLPAFLQFSIICAVCKWPKAVFHILEPLRKYSPCLDLYDLHGYKSGLEDLAMIS